jgi:hypothetical protein
LKRSTFTLYSKKVGHFECNESPGKIRILHYGVHHLQSAYTTGLLLKLENKFLVNLLRGTYTYPNSLERYEDKRNTKLEWILKEAVVTLSMYFTGI